MGTTPEAAQEHATIVALLIGGALALAGTVLSQAFGLWAGWIDHRRRHKALLRERFEELTSCASVTLVWYHNIGACKSLLDIHASRPPPDMSRMRVLTLIYFHELKSPVDDYISGLVGIYNWAIDSADPAGIEMVGPRMGRHPEREKRTEEIARLKNRLDDAIEAAAQKYASA